MTDVTIKKVKGLVKELIKFLPLMKTELIDKLVVKIDDSKKELNIIVPHSHNWNESTVVFNYKL